MKENDMELIVAAIGSPFNQEVREARLPEGFNLPAIKAYDGKSDPQDHLDHFNDLMELHLVSKLAKCRGLCCHPDKRCQEMVQVHPCWISLQLVATEYFFPPTFPSDQEYHYPFGTPQKCEIKEEWDFEVLYQPLQWHIKLRNLVIEFWNSSSPHKLGTPRDPVLGWAPTERMPECRRVLQESPINTWSWRIQGGLA